ncbi:HAD family hydrolase [Stappia sp. ES.058]|uniref:HAD family hydrolase n=1 Tax=Stappia sp. ES.058 TaxID=1881061 RepID=UPI00087B5739|nr:HAD family hydrolase [Stappia sp. ES.058]SDT93315.1 phosphoglycolate phosphatase [Stappia sp. ES.058]
MTSLKAVLFDKDGTLIDFQATWAPTFLTILEELSDGDGHLMVRLGEASGYDLATRQFHPDSIVVAGSNNDIAAAWADILKGRDIEALFADLNARVGDMSLPHLTPFADLLPVLDALAALGLRLGIATNDGEASARTQLATLGLESRFDAVIGFDSGHGAKPAPGMVQGFCDALGLTPAEVVMVGDSLHDMHAGRSAGAQTLGVTTGTVPAKVLQDHADHVVGSLTQALEWIRART